MLIDGNDISYGETLQVDLCIIGAGAAGITIARELVGAGFSLLMLESGDHFFDLSIQALNETTDSFLPISEDSRARQFGGTTTQWSGKWIPYTAIDFQQRPWIDDSGWPLTEVDLLPFYDRASVLHGGPSIDRAQEYCAPETTIDLPGGEPLVLTPVYWLPRDRLDFARNAGQYLAQASDIRVLLRSTATELIRHVSDSRVDRVEVRTPEGNSFAISAERVVVACGGIENARLLLASSSVESAGLGNQHDQVGRHYMDHPKATLASVHISRPSHFSQALGFKALSGYRTDIGMRWSHVHQRRQELLNAYLLFVPRYSWSEDKHLSALLDDVLHLVNQPGNLTSYRKVMASLVATGKVNLVRYLTHKLTALLGLGGDRPLRYDVQCHLEQIPLASNRVRLSHRQDMFAKPLAHIEWQLQAEERKNALALYGQLEALLESLPGCEFEWLGDPERGLDWPNMSDASHPMGTTRMGVDPGCSVVDPNCRVHSLTNLFVAGSSLFPTGGFSNPTWLLVALAIRLADHIKGEN